MEPMEFNPERNTNRGSEPRQAGPFIVLYFSVSIVKINIAGAYICIFHGHKANSLSETGYQPIYMKIAYRDGIR